MKTSIIKKEVNYLKTIIKQQVTFKKSSPNEFIKEMKKFGPLYLLMVPGILYFIIIKYIPMWGISIAFFDYKVWTPNLFDNQWVGLQNFKTFIQSPSFITVLRNTLGITGLKLIIGSPFPLILALMVNEIRNTTTKRVIQTVSYLPHFLSWVIVYGLFFAIFNQTYGAINNVLADLGLSKIDILTNKSWFWQTLLASHMWKNIGWSSIVYLAAISGIAPELYESAQIDGANRWQQTRHITIPSVLPVFAILFILALGKILNEDFEQVLMFMGGPDAVYMTDVGEVFETYVFRIGLVQARYSYAVAIEIFKSIVGLILVINANRIAKKYFNYRGVW